MLSAMIYYNRNKPGVYAAIQACLRACESHGIEPVFLQEDEDDLAGRIEGMERYRRIAVPDAKWIDMIFVFGGDGTVLGVLDAYAAYEIPILGINLGRLGFLLETQLDEIDASMKMLTDGAYTIEHRMMLRVEGGREGRKIAAYAVNDVCISRGLSQRMIALDALSGDTLIDHYIADGMVLASPTGSTAYSLSAGGPIVSPDVQCFVLCPICAHSLQSRPIVLSPQETITLRVNMKEKREGIQLSIDGQAVCQMGNQDQVTISRAKHDALLIRFPKERNFFTLLKDKLSQWSL